MYTKNVVFEGRILPVHLSSQLLSRFLPGAQAVSKFPFAVRPRAKWQDKYHLLTFAVC
jgi:hypothetical protein